MAGLYIHIPFCTSKCSYCDFVSFADHTCMDAYMNALNIEMKLASQGVRELVFDTVFIGGGTPSILPQNAIVELLHTARRCFALEADAEITIESNPGTLDAKKLYTYRSCGINRLSMGLQSAEDSLLTGIGRRHTASDFYKSFALARACGFNNINVDVMYGLPDQHTKNHIDTLQAICELNVEHISAYSLILEEGTPLFNRVKRGECILPDDDAVYDMHRQTIEYLKRAGYKRYEISNYALDGRMCRHNLNYWDNGEYLGIGLAAHSSLKKQGHILRFANCIDINSYVDKLNEGMLPTEEQTVIQRSEEMFECVMLGLRKTCGLKLVDFEQRFGTSLLNTYENAVTQLVQRGWLTITKDHIYLTDEGLDMQNAALLTFMEDD
ncbi:MAG: radical SAM family heme chaperone HemW [Clostridia bacterium]